MRVSKRGQSVENQLRLLKTLSKKRGWEVIRIFEDAGISGATGREKRPGLDGLLKAVARREVDLVAAWSVDRIGRSLQDLVATFSAIRDARVDLFLYQQGLDTTTPAGRAMYGMLSVFAEFELAIIKERIVAGMERAKADGKHIGRPSIPKTKVLEIRRQRRLGRTMREIAQNTGISLGTVQQTLTA